MEKGADMPKEFISILVVHEGQAKLTRFELHQSAEVELGLAGRDLAEEIARLRPDIVSIAADTQQASVLAEGLHKRGVPSTLFLVSQVPAEAGSSAQPQRAGVVLAPALDGQDPKQIVRQLLLALFRAQSEASLSPLTGMPGSGVLRQEVDARLARGEHFTFLYLDLDNFKAYNDYYGFARGDEAIQLLGRLVVEAVRTHGDSDDLCVHIGGDDFAVLASSQHAETIGQRILRSFEQDSPLLYDLDDRECGYITTTDRRGQTVRYPLMTVSIAAVSTHTRRVHSYHHLSDIAAEVKAYAKSLPGNSFARDRREDGLDASAAPKAEEQEAADRQGVVEHLV